MATVANEREELAAQLLDSLEHPPGIAVDDKNEIEHRAADARAGAPGIPWAADVTEDALKSLKAPC